MAHKSKLDLLQRFILWCLTPEAAQRGEVSDIVFTCTLKKNFFRRFLQKTFTLSGKVYCKLKAKENLLVRKTTYS